MGFQQFLNSCFHFKLLGNAPREGEDSRGGGCGSVVKRHCINSSPRKQNNKDAKRGGTNSPDVGKSNRNYKESFQMHAAGEMSHENGDIDEDLHSRQLAVYGRNFMRRIFASKVLISGMQGLGVEIAKNVILAGVKLVTLHDEGTVEHWDMSSSFIFFQKDLGKNRALASVLKLQELNSDVAVSALTTKLTEDQLSDYQAVVFTDLNMKSAIEFNEYCHNHSPPIAFIKTEVRGLFGSVFCDFGPEFTVFDIDGEEPHTGIIASISNDNPAFVTCVDDERIEFEDGDLVVFSEIQGMSELNDRKPRKIKNVNPCSFILDEDMSNFHSYERGGIVTQVKQPKLLNFKPLKEAIKDPGDFFHCDFYTFNLPALLHLAFQSLDKFVSEFGRFPIAGCEEDALNLISMTIGMNESLGDSKLSDINSSILRHFAFGARAVLNPMAAMFGGIVGQEVLKACSGKFHPMFQFFYFDSVESLPTQSIDPQDLRPLNSRYDAQISVFGSKFQKKLEDAQIFVVGSGALGCEFLKNLALMGVSCGDSGKVTITDDDIIEKSNLTRQFLFRSWNIGQAKSTVAASASSSINPSFHTEALLNRVGPETEQVFDDTFWENLNVVINALDNINARLYIDRKCLYFRIPLLESGTLGPKCNTQVIIPNLTENYGASQDPQEKQSPMCTLHSFPHNIDHCLTWARSEFEGLFEKSPSQVNEYLSNPDAYTSALRNGGDARARESLELLARCFDELCDSFQDCITWARLKFDDYFVNRVKQLTFIFPEDAATSSGAPFWSAPKRFPHPLQFSTADSAHLSFVMSASILRAETFGILVLEWSRNPNKLSDYVNKVTIPDFQPRKGQKIVTDENDTNLAADSENDAAVVNELVMKLEQRRKSLPSDFKMKPIQFEKDADTNYHMDFITACANMRARNYGIPEVDKLKAKFIAGRIIPAIATSTAMAAALVCLELYKVIDGSHPLEAYRNTFANLALPSLSMAEPVPPKVTKHGSMSWTAWDRWIMKNSPTLSELLQWLSSKGLNAYSVSYGSSSIYSNMFPHHRGRVNEKIVDLVREIAKAELPSQQKHLDVVVACEDDEENDIEIPIISVYYS